MNIEFVLLAKKTRESQKNYFSKRTSANLQKAMFDELALDEEIERIIKKQTPTLEL